MQQHGAFIIGVSSCNEEVCAAGGRISTQQGTALEIFDRSHDPEKNARLISKVTASGHTSTVEHVFFNLAFNNVSVVVEQFMIEFRLASFTVKSRRYVDFADCGYYVPSFSSDVLRERYTAHMDRLFALYAKLCDAGVPLEDARFVLPYCFYSNFFCSLGGRELVNVLRSMLYGRGSAYPEIREIGESLLKQAQEAAPGVFADFEEKNKNYRDLPDLPAFAKEADNGPGRAVELLSYDRNAECNVARAALIERYGCCFRTSARAGGRLLHGAVQQRVAFHGHAFCTSPNPEYLHSAADDLRAGELYHSRLGARKRSAAE